VRTTRRAARLVPLVAAAFLLSACGIPTTGVVQAGDPGTGVSQPTVVVYFVENDVPGGLGAPVPVSRPVDGPAGVATAVDSLFRGLDAEDQRHGLTTALPRLTAGPTVLAEGAVVRIGLPAGTPQLSLTAMLQLVCTVGYATQGGFPLGSPVLVAVAVPGRWQTAGTSWECVKAQQQGGATATSPVGTLWPSRPRPSLPEGARTPP
jgi:hypothetical protein